MEALDGNAIAGPLFEYFGAEMTTAKGTCTHCRAANQIAELRVYNRAPGSVVRCPNCGNVVIVLVSVHSTLRANMECFHLERPPRGDHHRPGAALTDSASGQQSVSHAQRPRLQREKGPMTMTDTQQMLDASPARLPVESGVLAAAIDAALNCAQTCIACADSDLIEEDVAALRDCIALCELSGDICDTTARVLSRPGHWDDLVMRPVLDACIRACTTCAEECDRHAHHHVHCAICARACRACITACVAVRDAAQR